MSLNVNSVNSTPVSTTLQSTNARSTETSNDTTSSTAAATATDDDAVVYTPSSTSDEYEFSIVEDRGLAATNKNTAEIDRMLDEAQAEQDRMTSLITKMMSKQTETYGKAFSFDDYGSVQAFKRGVESGSIVVDDETRLQAQKDVAEDGYYGVAKTSDRILDFAKAVAGDDPDKIAEMRNAVQKGFDQAAQMWGGSMDKMPQITKDTYDTVMKGFDEWEANANPSQAK